MPRTPQPVVPRSYRSLLVAYPRWWRGDHAAVVLSTQVECDLAEGRTSPSWADRLAFLARGALVSLASPSRPRDTGASLLRVAEGFHFFDQANGAVGTPELSERDQIRANADRDRNVGVERATALAPLGLLGGATH